MIDIDAYLPLAIDAATKALECAVSGESFDLEDVIAGSLALQALIRSADTPAHSLSGLSDLLLEFACDYPSIIPMDAAQRTIVSEHISRLRTIRGFL